MSTSLLRHLAIFSLLALSTAVAHAQAIRSNPGCRASTLERNDDDSTGLVPIGFRVNLFGKQRDSLYVNNNGNVTFDEPLVAYSPEPIREIPNEMIAAFWADVDTTGVRSNVVTYGRDTVGGRAIFCANYVNVGYFLSRDDKLNSFQIVLIDRSDTGAGNFDIEFNYERILWETGEASEGVNGFGGISARVGYTNGTRVADSSFELPGSGVPGSFLDAGPNALVRQSLNSGVPGRLLFAVRNGALRQSLTANPVSLLFRAPGDAPVTPAPQQVSLVSSAGPLTFGTPQVRTFSGGNSWLQVTANTTTTPGSLTVRVDPTGLARGAHTGEITVQPTDTTIPAVTIPVVVLVGNAVPFTFRSGVVNGASFVSGVIVPGSIFSVFGENLAAGQVAPGASTLPTALGGVSVLINGRAIPLFFISPGQINGFVPFDVALGNATLQVVRNNVQGPPVPIDVARTLPGLFSTETSSGIIQNQDFSLNTSANPARGGSVVIVYLTGIGPVDNPPPAGQPAPPTPLARATATFRATIAGRDAPVLFVGLTPGYIGLAQANIQVPAGIPAGPQQLVLFGNDVASSPVFVYVRP